SSVSPDDLIDFRNQNEVFEDIAGISPRWTLTLNVDGNAEPLFGFWVSASFFKILGVEPFMGRTFNADEDKPGGRAVIILSHSTWQRRHGGDRGIIGKKVILGGEPLEVIGVMPAGFRLMDDLGKQDGEVFLPLELNPFQTRGRNVRYLNALARLKPSVSIEQAKTEMAAIAARLEKQYPDTNTGFGISLLKLHEEITGNVRTTLMLLLAAVGVVLLIACANVANLMLVRVADRFREVAVRRALGANRTRIARQFLTESVMLSLGGAAAGVGFAYWGTRSLLSAAPNLPRAGEIGIDLSVLAFTFLLSLSTGVAFGIVPAFFGTRTNLNDSLKEGSRDTSGGAGRRRVRSALVVSEVALALVLLVASGLLIRSFIRLLNVDPGYRTENLLIVSSQVPALKYPQPADRLNLYYRIEDGLKSVPGVVSVGAISRFPLSGVIGSNNVTSFFMIEERRVPIGERPEIDYRVASTEYFETAGIPLIRGRKFTRQDGRDVVIVNQAAAEKFWPGQDPVGKRINFGNDPDQSPWVTIVAIAGNVRHLGLDVEPRPEVYRPYPTNPLGSPVIAVRTSGNAQAIVSMIRAQIQAVEREMPVTITTIDQLIDLSVAERRFSMFLIGGFGALAMLLAVVGIYGVMSYSVAQRTREIGLRMALGAQSKQVLRMIVAEGFVLTVIGVVLGFLGSLGMTRFMSAMLFGITPTDPMTYAGMCLLLVSIAVLASYIPARRATKVDPNVALRYE
ncbi:MAG: ABC transporter permease, partial [Acidobacteria bacterium]|nr:ABC transporter permease [Acidobacteriota bacterium]